MCLQYNSLFHHAIINKNSEHAVQTILKFHWDEGGIMTWVPKQQVFILQICNQVPLSVSQYKVQMVKMFHMSEF